MAGWQDKPFFYEVKAGQSLAFCDCEGTANPPFCDGSHSGSGKTPKVIKFEEDKKIWACGCRKSAKLPYCDGTHKGL